jgi:hypothetical protein
MSTEAAQNKAARICSVQHFIARFCRHLRSRDGIERLHRHDQALGI